MLVRLNKSKRDQFIAQPMIADNGEERIRKGEIKIIIKNVTD